MPTREKPRIHARDHEHGGADPQLIHYEDVGDGGGTSSSLQSFCTAEDSEDSFSGSTPHDLSFTHSYSFNTNDPATFDVSSDRVRILQAGGYLVLAQLNLSGFVAGESGSTVVEIYDVYGTDTDGNRVDGLSPTDTPGPAITSHNLLPGAGGFLPTLQYTTFINLRDDYAYSGTRPAVWPVTLHMRMSWSAASAHTLFYGLSVMRFG